MDIFVLPTEILLRVLSYLPQKELFTTVNKVCNYWNQLCLSPSLWTDISFHEEVYGPTKKAGEHFLVIQSYVIKLAINPYSLRVLFDRYKSLKFLNLKKLDISAVFVLLDDLMFTIAERCPQLNDLKLRLRLRIENKIFTEIRFRSLSRVCLDAIHIKFDHLSQNIDEYLDILISQQPMLQKLAIYMGSFIKDKTVEKILVKILDECRSLKSLIISVNQMSGRAFTHSMHQLELTELTIHSVCISDFELKYITQRAKQLRSLSIQNCKKITDDGLGHVGNCQFLERFCFGNINLLGDTTNSKSGLISVAEGCKNMKYFASIGWRTLDDNMIIHLVRSFKHLSYISIQWCESLTDASLIAISEHCEYLSGVNFEFCHNISLTGIICLISSCKHLLRLSLYNCLGISDGVTEIIDKANEPASEFTNTGDAHEGYSPDSILDNTTKSAVSDERKLGRTKCRHHHSPLKELVLESCINISNSVLLKLAAMCPDLYRIIISNCNIDTVEDFIIELNKRCTVLSTLKMRASVSGFPFSKDTSSTTKTVLL